MNFPTPLRVPQRESFELLGLRRRVLNPTLSLSYKEPLKIVRGRGVRLYDDRGQSYLDMVNNVCHVGHCHPHVVAALQRQVAELNTNTRYLHDNIVEYALRLRATLPPSLCVVFLTNSGTEANDLALRLARAHTKRNGILVLDHAYHGHSKAVLELSPYKFNGRGGEGCPPHVEILPMPDTYRGAHQGRDAGQLYGAHVPAAIAALESRGHELAAMFAEPLMGCGGQFELPPGYLASAYADVRAVGGLTIADEVQVGFGRVGTHFWAFERHGVLPDILTLGKPIANGHPMGAVVTTKAVADSFVTGMEYFNTFGGNPVSCAAAIAVLEVIEADGLQQQALRVGGYLHEGLRMLQKEDSRLGDVRGAGLFLGVEVVMDRSSRAPDSLTATAIVEAMKARNILLSTDGPFNNVLKIKPPLVLSPADVDEFLTRLREVLRAL